MSLVDSPLFPVLFKGIRLPQVRMLFWRSLGRSIGYKKIICAFQPSYSFEARLVIVKMMELLVEDQVRGPGYTTFEKACVFMEIFISISLEDAAPVKSSATKTENKLCLQFSQGKVVVRIITLMLDKEMVSKHCAIDAENFEPLMMWMNFF
jgi:hypothetical protein